jgi:hypothetical protein
MKPRRKRKNRNASPSLDHDAWVQGLPNEAQLFVYRRGRYIGELDVAAIQATQWTLSQSLIDAFGHGHYSLTPHYHGRFQCGRPVYAVDFRLSSA